MPLVAHSALPTFQRLRAEGMHIIPADWAVRQDIRELHIGLLNMMPDAALAATERQFFRLVGEANPIAQFYLHPFTLSELPRSPERLEYVQKYYEPFEKLQEEGLDALIITGANVTQPDLSQEPFWEPLRRVTEWALENVTSVLCSCLATHAIMEFRHGQKRRPLGFKRWGVFTHEVVDRTHPLVNDVNTLFDVPHSRFNEISREQFEASGLHVLAESPVAGAHLAVSPDGLRVVYFQGHPEYDTISLLKEYKREVRRFWRSERTDYPPFPDHYFGLQTRAILEEHRESVVAAMQRGDDPPELPEERIAANLHNTWHDSAVAVVGNWIGAVYQVTNHNRNQPFMADIDPADPLGWLAAGGRRSAE